MVALTGPLATASRESRQARKGATVVVTLCAEVWLVRVTAIFLVCFCLSCFTFIRWQIVPGARIPRDFAGLGAGLVLRSGVVWVRPKRPVTLSVAEGSPAAWQMTIVSLCALFIFLLSPYNGFFEF
jgi:hypothetical protein